MWHKLRYKFRNNIERQVGRINHTNFGVPSQNKPSSSEEITEQEGQPLTFFVKNKKIHLRQKLLPSFDKS